MSDNAPEAIRMDTRKRTFLDDIESDLTSAKPSQSVEVGSRSATAGYGRRLVRRMGVVGAALAAGTSFFALSGGAAYASSAAEVRPMVIYCGVPNPVPRDHTKDCGDGSYYSFKFEFSYPSGPGGLEDCYVFERSFFSLCVGSVVDTATICTG
ncbi:MAG: hypothetical protein ACQSGP_31490 [Frankia sp.]